MKKLFEPIDNSPLIVFRIFFGFLLAAETFIAIPLGWVKINLAEPKVFIPHIGFEFLEVFTGTPIYLYYLTMGLLGLMVMVGYRYKLSFGLFTILWTGSYLMQKASYNNHYYLLIVICIIMLFLPANKYASVDVKNNPSIKQYTMPKWCSWVLIFQISIVYFYATVAKFYPDWLDGSFAKLLFSTNNVHPNLNALFANHYFHLFISYSGILFDGLIIPALLYKKTRTIALIASLIFHLFNAATLQIGIFPFFALSFIVFFYEPEQIRKLFFKNKPQVSSIKTEQFLYNHLLKIVLIPFLILQTLLPIRHWLIKGDVLWTEEGHRLSWRMMLRTKQGFINYKIVNTKTKEEIRFNIENYLTPKQLNLVSTKPDAMWQVAQILKKEFKLKNIDIEIYIDSKIKVNNNPYLTFIDPNLDMANAKWDYFWHNDWILLYNKDNKIIP